MMRIQWLAATFLIVGSRIFVGSAQQSSSHVQPSPPQAPQAPESVVGIEIESLQGVGPGGEVALLVAPEPAVGPIIIEPPDNQDDPAYAEYKTGYELILDERWDEARKKFSRVVTKYPNSEYIDDAQYWSAYALKHIDRKKAREEYEKFIEANPKSTYCDDAVADLSQLEAQVWWVVAPEGTKAYVGEKRAKGYARHMKDLARKLRRQTRSLSPFWKVTGIPFASPADDEELDQETRLKMEVLFALGETKEDEKSFHTLKEVALDPKQHQRLREAAMVSLANFENHDVLPVFVEIAKNATNQDLQTYAIDCISERDEDKNKTVGLLVDLFNAIPKDRTEQVQTIFYSIAEVGNDKAVDFLTTIGLGYDDYELRRDAVYYLGNIGGERARAALYEILRGK